MRPILFEIFGWEVPSWHFFFVLAALTAYFIAKLCAQWAKVCDPVRADTFLEKLPNLFIICYLTGWFGARALSVVVEQLDVQGFFQFIEALFQLGPMTFYGGALAAVVCGLLYCWRSGLSLPFALDCGILGGILALGIGRIGCHLNGDDYGLPVSDQGNPPWWAVRYSLLDDGGIYRYPVQLEEAFASMVIFVVGLVLFRRAYSSQKQETSQITRAVKPDAAGWTAAWVALLSSIHRYFNEIFRGDPRGFFLGTQISTSSGIALLIVVFCALCLVRIRVRRPPNPAGEKL